VLGGYLNFWIPTGYGFCVSVVNTYMLLLFSSLLATLVIANSENFLNGKNMTQFSYVNLGDHCCCNLNEPTNKFIGLAYQGKDIVFRFNIEYSSLRDFGPSVNNNRSIFI
jgi:hypothetical protein